MKIIETVHSKIDPVTKYIIEDPDFGKNEVSLLRKETKDVIVLPSQTNCKMGCTFCHLTGTKRKAVNLSAKWMYDVVHLIIEKEFLYENPILVSFMGAGEPLENMDSIIDSMDMLKGFDEENKSERFRFALCTMVPSTFTFSLLTDVMEQLEHIDLKVHLSLHGMSSREKIIKSSCSAKEAIAELKEYNKFTGRQIEYHYTLVDGVNDSIEELTEFRDEVLKYVTEENLLKTTVKFLELSETGKCKKSTRTKEELLELFKDVIVEFYDPPGRDVGSSCGMFNRDIYNEV